MIATAVRLTLTPDLVPEVTLTLADSRQVVAQRVAEWQGVLAKGPLSVEIKQHRQRRSLDANAMMWQILGQMAAALRTTKDELYIEMLSRYGVFSHIVVKPHLVDRIKQEWRTLRVLGEVTVNGQTGIQLQVFFGSSTYTSKEFSVLLDGVISDAKEIGIDVISESEKARLIEEWGAK